MTISVEFLLGTTIEFAIAEAKEKAVKFDVAYIVFDFNGKKISVGQNCDIEESLIEYRENRSEKYFVFNK